MTQPALSKNRAVILDALKAAPQPMSAYDILDKVRACGIKSPPIVYRALKFLEEQGYIHRIESKNAYIACHGDHARHTASILLVCQRCGKVEETSEPTLAGKLSAAARLHQFVVNDSVIELRGHCSHCS